MNRPDAIILGAGAAGLFCALTAGRRGVRVVLADHAPVIGRKVRLAGGGRGNLTNLRMGPEWYVGEQPAFCAAALRGFPPRLFLELLNTWGVPWEEREEGRIFGLESASLLVEALVEAVRESGGSVLPGREIAGVSREPSGFTVRTSKETVTAPQLVLALGGPAQPQTGATDLGLRLARSLGHRVIPVRPALAPLLLPEDWPLRGLAGIGVPVRAGVNGRNFAGPLLFTHRGLSGPAVLQASCFWRPGTELEIDFLPDHPFARLLHAPENGRLTPLALLRRHLPDRLAARLLPPDLAEAAADRHAARWSRQEGKRLAAAVHAHRVVPVRTGGFRRAEVAAGGVDVAALFPRTLESRIVPGLYIVGETLDVTGLLGGYNLHWAWASGKAAGESLGRSGPAPRHPKHTEGS